ncbi:MAG: transglutaminase-like domain-containing protein [Oscillospiraceae bacterium]|nr:transglutaminase-like domain-containing protein [Oscillospiraceae bacterium]
MKKRMTALLLAIAIIVCIPLNAFAAVATPSLKFSHTSTFSISASPNSLIFTLPSSSEFAYLRISLEDERGDEHNLLWTQRQQDSTAVYSLDGVRNGTYYLQLYTLHTQYGNYVSYLYGRAFKVVVTNTSVYFELAPTYENNVRRYGSKRSDSGVLSYYLKPSEGVQSDNIGIITLAERITSTVKGDFERARAIHDWVCDNIWYDEDVLSKRVPYGEQSALSTFNSKRGVCLGYANLTAALMRAAGIPTKVVFGYALWVEDETEEWTAESAAGKLNANHAWNEFYVNGRWVITDTTWNTDNSYSLGEFSRDTGLINHYYFDITLEVFSVDHLIYEYSEDDIPKESVSEATSAVPTRNKVMINDREIVFDCYNIADENYFKLRDIMWAINGTSKQFNALYDTGTRAISLLSQTPYVPDGSEMKSGDGKIKTPVPTSSLIFKDGSEVIIKAYLIGDNNYFRLRDIAIAFNIFVDLIDNVIVVDTSRDYYR